MGSACVMDFKREDKKISVDLPARSLLVINEESRYAWSHGICPRHNDNVESNNGFSTRPRGIRVSFTFRKIRKENCNCRYSDQCDTKKKNNDNYVEKTIDDTVAINIENSYVHEVRFFYLFIENKNDDEIFFIAITGLRRNFQSF